MGLTPILKLKPSDMDHATLPAIITAITGLIGALTYLLADVRRWLRPPSRPSGRDRLSRRFPSDRP